MIEDAGNPKPKKVAEAEPARNKTVQVDPELYARIEQLANESERTVSKQANRIIRKALEAEITGD